MKDKACEDCEFYDECPADETECLRIKSGLEPLELDGKYMNLKDREGRFSEDGI